MTEFLPALLLGYALGSIPFGLLLTMGAGLGDVRKQGSGNIGATNVLRTGNKGLAAVTLLLDLTKGFLAVWLAANFFSEPPQMPQAAWGPIPAAALGAVLGHCFPIWLGFKGGKGVAANAGVAFGLGGWIGLAYAAVWLGMLAAFRFSSLAGMTAVVCAAIAAALVGKMAYVPVLLVIAALVIWLHRANIGRLQRGEEPKVGRGS